MLKPGISIKQSLFKGIKSLTFLFLLIVVIFFYGIDIYTKYRESDTTFTTKTTEIKDFTTPPLTICMENGLKPTVLKKYGLSNIFAFNFGSNTLNKVKSSVWDAFIEGSYILNRDFKILVFRVNGDFEPIQLSVGENYGKYKQGGAIQFLVNEYYTNAAGTCYQIRSNLTLAPPNLITIKLTFNNLLTIEDFPKGLAVDTFQKMSRGVRPTLYNIPIQNGTWNNVFLEVSQEEWYHLNGNNKNNLEFEDCFPWEQLLRLAINCTHKCLPVNLQFSWEQNAYRPKCHNGSDHICMMKAYQNLQLSIPEDKYCLEPKKDLNFKSDVQIVKGNPLKISQLSIVDIIIKYKSRKKTIHEEKLIYDSLGMIYQLGGVVSLFLGISFFNIICDLLNFVERISS